MRGGERAPGSRRPGGRRQTSGPVKAERLYVLRVGDRVLRLDADGLISYVRRLYAERELGLPPGALTDEERRGMNELNDEALLDT